MSRIYMQSNDNPDFVIDTDNPDLWSNYTRISVAKGKAIQKKAALKFLRKYVKPKATIYCVLRSVSRSGMYRVISFFVPYRGDLVRLDGWIKDVGIGDDRQDGVGVGGCGMDMGFHVVYELGSAIWPKGTRKPHGMRNGEPDTCGGYALKHSWL